MKMIVQREALDLSRQEKKRQQHSTLPYLPRKGIHQQEAHRVVATVFLFSLSTYHKLGSIKYHLIPPGGVGV